jgi:adenylate kinase
VGKGTQSKHLARRYGVCHISTGDLLRAEIAKKSQVGQKVSAAVSEGELVPDKLLLRIVRRHIARVDRCRDHGWLLDGFPRTAAQALAMVEAGLIPHRIIVLDASERTVTQRILGRAHAAGKAARKDDTAATVSTRLREYSRHKNETLRAFSELLRLHVIDGERSADAVSDTINAFLGEPAATARPVWSAKNATAADAEAVSEKSPDGDGDEADRPAGGRGGHRGKGKGGGRGGRGKRKRRNPK